ncbi:hypothetical protein OsI_03328 [Oryza sativa Indica Group]|uniref:Uncharacterized protein n=1 Tax=Oryza sativa subsp. indica TaxID=39946 RepID=B8A7P3_ORYSI|nr:hypothetical protein OsI_03328 [Oryza sativa Indica Group]
MYALTGGRPRRRPRKRPRVVQRQLDRENNTTNDPANNNTSNCLVQSLFPGLWLTEITADAYKVPDD